MATTEYGPTAPARIGTITRKPLPKIEARGVVVALTSGPNMYLFLQLPQSVPHFETGCDIVVTTVPSRSAFEDAAWFLLPVLGGGRLNHLALESLGSIQDLVRRDPSHRQTAARAAGLSLPSAGAFDRAGEPGVVRADVAWAPLNAIAKLAIRPAASISAAVKFLDPFVDRSSP